MGDFVRSDRGDRLLQVDRTLLLVDQQNDFPEGDATYVLHSSSGKVRQPNQVQLAIGILDSEVVVVVADYVFRRIEGEFAHLLFPRSAVNTNGNTVDRAFNVFEVANHQRSRIR